MRSAAGVVCLPFVGCGGDGTGTGRDAGSGDAGPSAPSRDAGDGGDGGDGGPAAVDAGRGDAGGAADPDAGASAELCQPFLSPDGEFPPLYGGNGTVEGWVRPQLDGDRWRLSVEGLVRDPRQISLAELEADTANHVQVVNTLQCVFGTRGTAIFTGVPLRVLLERAGLQRASTRRLRFFGADGFNNNLRLADVFEPEPEVFEPLVAFRMNGAQLSHKLGFPARLLLADRFGFKNIKWLSVVEATDSDVAFGQYQAEPFAFADDAGLIAPNARMDGERSVPAGPIRLCGHGLSGFGGIERVQLSVDGRAFESARLLTLDEVAAATPGLRDTLQFQNPEAFPWPYRGVWAPWELEQDLAPGEHTLSYRIVDRGGRVADGFNMIVRAE